LRGEDTWSFLVDIKAAERTRHIPIVVASSIDDQQKAFSLGAESYLVKPFDRGALQKQLLALTSRPQPGHVLIIDDDERDRYVLRQYLRDLPVIITEAASGLEGLARARADRPAFIFLDLSMPGMNGFDVLRELKGDIRTRDIGVIIHTSRELHEDERLLLGVDALAIVPKSAEDPNVIRQQVTGILMSA
jgi:CheY-like chemotaxis protein